MNIKFFQKTKILSCDVHKCIIHFISENITTVEFSVDFLFAPSHLQKRSHFQPLFSILCHSQTVHCQTLTAHTCQKDALVDAHERSSSGWLDCYPCQTSVMMLCFVRCRSLGNHPLLIISSVLLLGLRCDLGVRGMRYGAGRWGDPYWPWPCAHQDQRSGLREAAVFKGMQWDQGIETDVLLMSPVTPQAEVYTQTHTDIVMQKGVHPTDSPQQGLNWAGALLKHLQLQNKSINVGRIFKKSLKLTKAPFLSIKIQYKQ